MGVNLKARRYNNMSKFTMYECEYLSGGGTWYQEGTFRVLKSTDKALTLELVDPGFYCMYPDEKIRRIPKEKGTRTKFCPAVEWDGDVVTVYHESAGTPYRYSPLFSG